VLDETAIAEALVESGRVTDEECAELFRYARRTGRAPYDALLSSGKVGVEELAEAIAVRVVVSALREGLGAGSEKDRAATSCEGLRSYVGRIALLLHTVERMASQRDAAGIVHLLLKETPAIIRAERAVVFIADYEGRVLTARCGCDEEEVRIPWNSGIAGWVFTHGTPALVPDVYADPRFNRQYDLTTGRTTANMICAPLCAPGGRTLGAVQALNNIKGSFTRADVEMLEILGRRAAVYIQRFGERERNAPASARSEPPLVAAQDVTGRESPLDVLVGDSAAMREVRSLIQTVAPNDTTVLIQGESGTGKELAAKAIHRLSPRAHAPMVTLNCAAVPAELIESELFGHRKGSFTGAFTDHKGLFRSAHNGVLFLDEIEATSPAMQVKLLRAIQEQEIRPVGETASHKVDVRIIAATNKDLAAMIRQRRFREDLYYRINVFPIVIPPLRTRPEDVAPLVEFFLERLAERTGKRVRGVDPAAMEALMRYDWPGNARELENEIERAHVLAHEGGRITVGGLSPRLTASVEETLKRSAETARPVKLIDAVRELEKRLVEEALAACRGNKSRAAKRLGLSRQGLLNKLGRYGAEGDGKAQSRHRRDSSHRLFS
jgi:Nif-specific regulatory protein